MDKTTGLLKTFFARSRGAGLDRDTQCEDHRDNTPSDQIVGRYVKRVKNTAIDPHPVIPKWECNMTSRRRNLERNEIDQK